MYTDFVLTRKSTNVLIFYLSQVIDPIVPRYTALLRGDAVPVTISGAVVESRKVCKHPKVGDVVI